MNDQEKAQRLLDRASRRMSGAEITCLREVVGGEPLTLPDKATILSGNADLTCIDRRNQFIRLCTEFAADLR